MCKYVVIAYLFLLLSSKVQTKLFITIKQVTCCALTKRISALRFIEMIEMSQFEVKRLLTSFKLGIMVP